MTRKALRPFCVRPDTHRFAGCVFFFATIFVSAQLARGADSTVSFRNDVMAVLSKAGCNAGACHGNANGKAGFKLSLRGEDPELDFKALTRDLFGRRVDPEAPDQSLILLKSTT